MYVTKGFTLLEVLIYIALFSLLMTGAMTTTCNVLEGVARAQTHSMMQEEGGFVLAKIAWVLANAHVVTEPSSGATGTSLRTIGFDSSLSKVDVLGTRVRLDQGGGPEVLTNGDMQVMHLFFVHTGTSTVGTPSEEVSYSFEVRATTPNGMVLIEQFPTTTVSIHQ